MRRVKMREEGMNGAARGVRSNGEQDVKSSQGQARSGATTHPRTPRLAPAAPLQKQDYSHWPGSSVASKSKDAVSRHGKLVPLSVHPSHRSSIFGD
jgi:hypothetical protein